MSSPEDGADPQSSRRIVQPASLFVALPLAGFGGMLPTISRLAAIYVADPSTPVPDPGLYLGLGLFFVIGVALFAGLSQQRTLREALIIGIAGPGLITNIAAGLASKNIALLDTLAPSAYAQNRDQPLRVPMIIIPEVQRITPGFRSLQIDIIATGVDAKSNLPLVNVYTSDQTVGGSADTPIARLFIGQFVSLSISTQIRQLFFVVGDKRAAVTLPADQQPAVRVEVVFEPKNDFLWALGFKREARVERLAVSVTATPGS